MTAAIDRAAVDAWWATTGVPTLEEFVRIEAVSPSFDPGWQERGGLDAIVDAVAAWLGSRDDAPTITVSRIEGRTPLLLAQTPGSTTDAPNVLFYGHLDKQPEGTGWTVTTPWEPVVRDGRLYGRGSADDAYAPLAAWGAIEAARATGAPMPSCTILLEASEESSSVDLPAHLDALAEQIGTPDVVICLDAFSPDDRRVWSTSSLRGIVVMDVTVQVLTQAAHSGDAGSVVPSPFRVMRQLFDRLEDASTGRVLLDGLYTTPPATLPGIVEGMVGAGLHSPMEDFPLVDGIVPEHAALVDQFVHRAWDPAIAYAGMDGFPSTASAASVILPTISTRLSVRIPPDLDPAVAAAVLSDALTADAPSGAAVTVDLIAAQGGFSAPLLAPGLEAALHAASQAHFGETAGFFAAGVTIPFMGMLGDRFPGTQVLTLGALGPGSNPHSADESLDLRAAAALTAAVAQVLVTGL
jgi:acetylornithine deacetylase/succinyl-diaminopimelate desuccinylase-like protein